MNKWIIFNFLLNTQEKSVIYALGPDAKVLSAVNFTLKLSFLSSKEELNLINFIKNILAKFICIDTLFHLQSAMERSSRSRKSKTSWASRIWWAKFRSRRDSQAGHIYR